MYYELSGINRFSIGNYRCLGNIGLGRDMTRICQQHNYAVSTSAYQTREIHGAQVLVKMGYDMGQTQRGAMPPNGNASSCKQ